MKPWARRVGIALAALAIAAGLFWFVWLPNHRPALEPGERYGIDVSHHQGPIDWGRVAADGISFSYIKATEGGDFTDDRFEANWEGSAEAGLERGAYHFFTLCTSGDVQAQNFLRTVPQDAEALAPGVDLELAGNCADRPDPASVRRELDEFLQLVESGTGQTVVLYVSNDFDDRYAIRDSFDRPLWELRFLRRPAHERWMIWQVMSFAHVEGVEGDVDLDVMRVPQDSASSRSPARNGISPAPVDTVNPSPPSSPSPAPSSPDKPSDPSPSTIVPSPRPPVAPNGPWDTLIGLTGIILAVVLLTVGVRKPDISTPLKAFLSVLETIVLLVSVMLFGWLGLAVFLASATIAFVLYGIGLAMRQETLLVSAAVESNTTKEEMEALHNQLRKAHTAFRWLGSIRTAELIRLLAQRARSPQEIIEMALPIAMLFAAFQPGRMENLVVGFDRLLRLSRQPASESMRTADVLTRATQLGAGNLQETLDGLLAFYESSA